MNTPKTAPLEEKVDNKFINQPSQTLTLTIFMSLIFILSTITILWWAKRRQYKLTRHGKCLLLCGISNSGKTVLFNRLTTGIEKQTLTSVTSNHGIMALDYMSSDQPIKKVHVIDIPGHLRMRQRDFNAYKTSAKAIIFVIDSATFIKESKDVSDYLYDILHENNFRNQRLPLLILCNKQDLNENDQDIQSVCQLLEHKLTIKRKINASSVNLHKGKNVDIGRLGKETFEFNDVKDIRLEFVDGTALDNEKKTFTKQHEDSEDSDSGSNLLKVHKWIAKIWFK